MPRSYVMVTAKPAAVYHFGAPCSLTWFPITEDVRDPQIYAAHPGEYAIHPKLDRVYILPKRTDGNPGRQR